MVYILPELLSRGGKIDGSIGRQVQRLSDLCHLVHLASEIGDVFSAVDKYSDVGTVENMAAPLVAQDGVPLVATRTPRQLRGEGPAQIVQHPGDDDVVVDTNNSGYHHHSPAKTCIYRDMYRYDSVLLPQGSVKCRLLYMKGLLSCKFLGRFSSGSNYYSPLVSWVFLR